MLPLFLKNIETDSLPPLELVPWLTYSQSITKKLQDKVGEAHLEILKQQWCNITWWESHVLGISPSQQVFRREILISAQGKQCWYARTIIPANTYQAHNVFFARLEQESLGKLIFNNKEVTRLSLNYYPIFYESIEYHWLRPIFSCQPSCENLWARLAVFTINAYFQFYLVEIFLPDFLQVIYELD